MPTSASPLAIAHDMLVILLERVETALAHPLAQPRRDQFLLALAQIEAEVRRRPSCRICSNSLSCQTLHSQPA